MTLVWLNGRVMDAAQAGISPFDRGFLLGDGAFETMRVVDGKVLRLADHVRRLRAALTILGFPSHAVDREQIRDAVATLSLRRGLVTGVARVTISRGQGPRGLTPPTAPELSSLITLDEMPTDPSHPVILACGTGACRYPGLSSAHKLIGYGAHIADLLAARRLHPLATDALVEGEDATVLGGTFHNVLLRLGGRWVTPPADGRIRAGVMRAALLATGHVTEGVVMARHMDRVEAMMLTNAVRGAVMVERLVSPSDIEGRQLDTGRPGWLTQID